MKILNILGCVYNEDDFGLYANSQEEYWSEIDDRLVRYKLKDLVKLIDVWNGTSKKWNRVFHDREDNTSNFRSLLLNLDQVI